MTRHRLEGSLVSLFLSLGVSIAYTQSPEYAKPTKEQLAAATKAFESVGGKLTVRDTPSGKLYVFHLRSQANDNDLNYLPGIPFSFGLDLDMTKVTDAGLKELTKLKNLTSLDLYGSRVTEKGLNEIVKLKELAVLRFGGPKVTDQGLKEIIKLRKLTTLDLGFAKVTDVGLKELASLKTRAGRAEYAGVCSG